jgi:hypothetical protein
VSIFRKKSGQPKKVSLPPNWPLEIPAALPIAPRVKRVINLSTPLPAPKVLKEGRKIITPVPAKLGNKTLNLGGKPDRFTRPSQSVIDMRSKPKKQ